jgi:hypothetical protein
VPIQDFAGYARTPDGRTLRNAVETQAIPTSTRLPGDLLLLRFDREPQHLAIATDLGMIHSYAAARRVVEHRIDAEWLARIVGVWRFPGVE